MAGKYLVITDKLELELKKMRSEGRSRLPSEKELSERFSCSRQTVRASLDILQQKGLIEKRKGSGSYLADGFIKNKTIYFMTEDCDRYRSSFIITGLREKLVSSGYELKPFSSGGSINGEKEVLSQVIAVRPSVLIIEPSRDLVPNPNIRITEEIRSLGIPVIYCNSSLGDIHITADSAAGAKKLTDLMTGSGRKKTACIFRYDDSSGHDFYSGYIDAVFDSGSVFDEEGSLPLSYEEEKDIISGRDKRLGVFAEKIISGFDAVICHNRVSALRLIQILDKKGISVQEDIAVACFDNMNGFPGTDGMISLEYDNDICCRALASAAVALAEGRSAKSVTVPVKST